MNIIWKINWFTALFAWLSGHSVSTVEKLDGTERIRIVALGMTLILPVSISALGAFATVTKVYPEGGLSAAIVSASVVGIFTLIVDRALLACSTKSALSLVLRIALTVVTSTVFAHTALLWLFAERIELQADANRLDKLESVAARFRPDFVSITSKERQFCDSIAFQITDLSENRNSKITQLADIQLQVNALRKTYQSEVNGTGKSGVPGEGKEARRILSVEIEPLERQEARLIEEMKFTESRLAELMKRESALLKKIAADDQRTAALAETFEGQIMEQEYRGILTQFLLLHEILKEDRMALAAYGFVSALLLLWELLPVFLKFLLPSGQYQREQKLRELEGRAIEVAAHAVIEDRVVIEEEHQLRMELMRLDELEAKLWLEQAETRFEIVQARRAAIPKRATPEQREAYLMALNVLIDSLIITGKRLLIRREKPES